MEKVFCYCLTCKKETELIIDNIIIKYPEKLYHGHCKECNSYLCRVVTLIDRNF